MLPLLLMHTHVPSPSFHAHWALQTKYQSSMPSTVVHSSAATKSISAHFESFFDTPHFSGSRLFVACNMHKHAACSG